MSENKYPKPEKTASANYAEALLQRSLEQFKRVSSAFMNPGEFDEQESLTRTMYLATNSDQKKPSDPILMDESINEAYSIRFLGRTIRQITFTKDYGDISLGMEVTKPSSVGNAADIEPSHLVLSSNPDGVFVSGVPVDLAIATEAALKPLNGTILQQFNAVMNLIEMSQVVGQKPDMPR